MKGDGKPVSFIEDCAVDLDDLADYTERLNERVRAARHQGHLVRARLGRLPARAPGAEHEGPGRRRDDARGGRGMLRPGARIQGHPQRRARRRHRAQRIPRNDVRPAHRPRVRDGEGRVRSRTACSTPAASCARRAWTTARCSATRPGYAAAAGVHAEARLVGPSRTAGGMLGAVEMCNNNGTCRAFDAGVMCPSYRVTRDETPRHARPRQHPAPGADRPARRRCDGRPTRWPRRWRSASPARPAGANARPASTWRSMKIEVHGRARRAAWRRGARPADRRTAALRPAAPRASPPLANLRNRIALAAPRSAKRISGSPPTRPLPDWRRDRVPRRRSRRHVPRRTPRGDVHPVRRHLQPLVRAGEPARRAARAAPPRATACACRQARGRPLCCGRTYLAAGRSTAPARRQRRTLGRARRRRCR